MAFKLCLITYKSLNDRRTSDYISYLVLHQGSSRQKTTILVEKSSTCPTIFHEAWRLFLLYRRTHSMEQPSRQCEERIICGPWRHLNTSSTPNFLNNRITAVKSFN